MSGPDFATRNDPPSDGPDDAANAGRRLSALAVLTFLAGFSALAADAPLDIASVAGVYKHSFENGNVEGDKYRSEDILELVQVSPKTAYFRTHLEFYNGHECTLYGVAEVEGNALVYHDPETDYQGKHCVLRIEKGPAGLTFREADPSWPCKNLDCGARGSFDGETFATKERRTIRYMPRLLASTQYREAMDEYAKAHRGKPPQ